MWTCEKCIDVSLRVLLKKQFLQLLVEKFQAFGTPKASGHWRLIGHNANEVALAPQSSDNLCRTIQQLNLVWMVDIACFSKVQHTVAVQESHGRFSPFLERMERCRLHEGSVHGAGFPWRLMGFVLIWRP